MGRGCSHPCSSRRIYSLQSWSIFFFFVFFAATGAQAANHLFYMHRVTGGTSASLLSNLWISCQLFSSFGFIAEQEELGFFPSSSSRLSLFLSLFPGEEKKIPCVLARLIIAGDCSETFPPLMSAPCLRTASLPLLSVSLSTSASFEHVSNRSPLPPSLLPS